MPRRKVGSFAVTEALSFIGLQCLQECVMKKFAFGMFVGAIIAFPLGINFGKDVPLFSNPFASKPDIPDRVVERTGKVLEETKEAIHEATRPVQDKLTR
jgi:hypothetical protein